ncbi:MAG: alanine--tRNA ligase [Bacteroidota bacterium]
MKTSTDIRNTFLTFFEQKLHQIVKSAPVVLKDDPTLMFTNAGMNQFKDIFLGLKSPKTKRVADTQKCLRVSGKHNDLEEVGHDTYHHTMFEMLGNWSFGDYYKQEAIEWAWTLLTEGFEMDPGRLYVTIFEGDEQDGVPIDEDARTYWKTYLPEERILPFDKKDNFWEMGAVGPAGPCSEIHVDMRSEEERAKVDGASLVNADHPEVIEIWNLVFIQYNRLADKSLEELPDKHIDTGMGFERLVMALQNKKSSYDTDLFDGTKAFLQARTGLVYADASEEEQIAMRVIMDHIRAITFAIADGQLPSNTERGYVIRRILRRAVRYGYKKLGLEQPFLHEMVPLLAQQYKGVFDEVEAQQEFLQKIILSEEKSFLGTLAKGETRIEKYIEAHPGLTEIDPDFAFELYDTFGFPFDLTQVIAGELELGVDKKAFNVLLEQQKQRSRSASAMTVGDWTIVQESSGLPEFKGYDTLSLDTEILQYRTVQVKNKSVYQLVLAETPFYAESGGQIGDKGTIHKGEEVIKVLDTKKENELIVHMVDRLPSESTGVWTAQVYPSFRAKVAANHTGTHLLHAALRQVLGKHVEQRGSLVSDKLLRFDFSHTERVSEEELQQIESIVNERISLGIPLLEHRNIPIAEAKSMGAMALFGEKYGEFVRTIVFDSDFSVELCGGTHVDNTQAIRFLKLVSESSSAAGIRRVEAYTGDRAINFLAGKADVLQQISSLLKNPQNVFKAVEDLNEKNKQLEKQIQQFAAEKVGQLKSSLKSRAVETHGIHLIKDIVEVGSSNDLKQLSYDLRNSSENTLVVLGAVIKNKPLLSVIMTDDLAQSGKYNAGNLVRELAKEIKGGGGGQPFYATAGGKDASGLSSAIGKVEELL